MLDLQAFSPLACFYTLDLCLDSQIGSSSPSDPTFQLPTLLTKQHHPNARETGEPDSPAKRERFKDIIYQYVSIFQEKLLESRP